MKAIGFFAISSFVAIVAAIPLAQQSTEDLISNTETPSPDESVNQALVEDIMKQLPPGVAPSDELDPDELGSIVDAPAPPTEAQQPQQLSGPGQTQIEPAGQVEPVSQTDPMDPIELADRGPSRQASGDCLNPKTCTSRAVVYSYRGLTKGKPTACNWYGFDGNTAMIVALPSKVMGKKAWDNPYCNKQVILSTPSGRSIEAWVADKGGRDLVVSPSVRRALGNLRQISWTVNPDQSTAPQQRSTGPSRKRPSNTQRSRTPTTRRTTITNPQQPASGGFSGTTPGSGQPPTIPSDGGSPPPWPNSQGSSNTNDASNIEAAVNKGSFGSSNLQLSIPPQGNVNPQNEVWMQGSPDNVPPKAPEPQPNSNNMKPEPGTPSEPGGNGI